MRLVVSLAGLLFLNSAFAGVEWETKTAELEPRYGDKAVTAEYSFKNVGSELVTIASVKTTCGCTTAALDKKTYLPGETGRISVKFDIGQRKGLQSKQIHVRIAGESFPTVLIMRVSIPQPIVLKPSLVFWEVGEALEEKTIEFLINDPAAGEITDATSNNSIFATALLPSESKKKCSLVIRPTSTAGAAVGVLDVKLTLANGQQKDLKAFAQIRKTRGGKPLPNRIEQVERSAGQ